MSALGACIHVVENRKRKKEKETKDPTENDSVGSPMRSLFGAFRFGSIVVGGRFATLSSTAQLGRKQRTQVR